MAKPSVGTPVRLCIVAPVLAAAIFFAPVPAAFIDRWYSQGVYPPIQGALTAATNVVPGAVIDWMIAAAALLVFFRAIQFVLRALTGHPLAAVSEAARRLTRGVGLVALLFLVLWGLNYRRLPLETALGGPPDERITTAALRTAVIDANALAARVRPRDELAAEVAYPALADALRQPMNQALSLLGRTPLQRPGVPKSSLILTPFFTWAGVNGMINPLALESIVHPGLVPAERGFVLAHEWAHLAGHADEAEASAVGWLACMKGAPVLAYSASLYLIMEAGGAMPRSEWRAVSAKLDAGVRADLTKINERMQEQKPRVQQAATRVYDEYLKANRVTDGTASYGRALTLILTPRFKDAMTTYGVKPVRR